MSFGVIILCLALSLCAQYSPNIRNDQDIDKLLLRLAHRYDLVLPTSFYSKPMQVEDITFFLNKVDSLDSSGLLTQYESNSLANLRKSIRSTRNLFSWKKEDWETENYVNLSLLGRIKPSVHDSSAIYLKGDINPQFSGCKGPLSYYSEINVWTEFQSDTTYPSNDYEPYQGNAYNLYGRAKSSSTRSSDLFRGGITYRGKRLNFETAVDYLRQGPTLFYPLTFSGNGSPVTYLRANMNLFAFNYVHAFGQLKTQKDRAKFFYMHRLDIPLFNNKLLLGINEVVINGETTEKAQNDSINPRHLNPERSLEWVYLIPFVPFAFAEHFVGNRDNAVLSFDCNLSLPKNFRWYFEFFIDDISSPFTLFSDDFGNKWAFTVGSQYFGLLAKRDLTLSIEYSRIEPWVYTHSRGGSHRYTHYGASLGSAAGPNSASLMLLAEYGLGKMNSLGLFMEDIRTNRSVRGGSINDVFQGEDMPNPDSMTKKFLGSGTKRLTQGGIFWRVAPFGLFSMTSKVVFNSKGHVTFDLFGGFFF